MKKIRTHIIEDNPEHPKNACSPIVVTESVIFTLVILDTSLNILAGQLFSVALVNESQPLNTL